MTPLSWRHLKQVKKLFYLFHYYRYILFVCVSLGRQLRGQELDNSNDNRQSNDVPSHSQAFTVSDPLDMEEEFEDMDDSKLPSDDDSSMRVAAKTATNQ